MTLKTVERQIIERLVSDLLKDGYLVSVNDGEETVLVNSQEKKEILAAMFSTDEDVLYVSHPRKPKSWVKLIRGNDQDVISSHSINLTYLIDPICQWIERSLVA
jgi:hypothetical protein